MISYKILLTLGNADSCFVTINYKITSEDYSVQFCVLCNVNNVVLVLLSQTIKKRIVGYTKC